MVRNADVYAPEPLGRRDILVVNERVAAIGERLPPPGGWLPHDEIDAAGMLLTPGLIDGHVHILGGGGEGGPTTRTPQVSLERLITGGTTSVIGLLGFDSITRSITSLLATARALQQEGISAWIYTGAYQIPPRTITGNVETDIVLIREVVGVGEIAVSDQRGSQAEVSDLIRLGAQARVGGFLAHKAGKVHLHMGDGTSGLRPLSEALERSELPASQFYPTHVNRQDFLLTQAAAFAKRGAPIDITAACTPELGEPNAVPPPQALKRLLDDGVDPALITMTSDGNGSLPIFDAQGRLEKVDVGSTRILWEKLRTAVTDVGLPLEVVLRVATCNVADILSLVGKGRLAPGLDADFLLLDDDLRVHTVIARGRVAVRDGRAVIHGPFHEGDASRTPS